MESRPGWPAERRSAVGWPSDAVGSLDVGKARELVDGYAPRTAPYLDLGEPSWFPGEAARRAYWLGHATEIVRWARGLGLANPHAALRYGLPASAHRELWAWGS